MSRYKFTWWEPCFWYDFVLMPLIDKGFSHHSLINTDVFEVLNYLFSLTRVNELKAAVNYCQSQGKDSDPKGAAKYSNILDHKGNKIDMKAVNVKQQIEELED